MKLHSLLTLLTTLLVSLTLFTYSANAKENAPAFSGDFSQLSKMENKSKPSATALVNINNASAKELSSLPGLGAKKAEAIIEYRELNGNFTSVEELVNVKGIGPKMLAKLKGMIAV